MKLHEVQRREILSSSLQQVELIPNFHSSLYYHKLILPLQKCYLCAAHISASLLHILCIYAARVLHTQYIHIACVLHTQNLAQRRTCHMYMHMRSHTSEYIFARYVQFMYSIHAALNKNYIHFFICL